LRKKTVDGRSIVVFDDAEEAKWFFHAILCKDPSNQDAQYIIKLTALFKPKQWTEKMNEYFQSRDYEVKT
jgi:hypothetical protein